MDILLTQSYLIERDPPEKRIMRPYPPLGIMYLASYLMESGFSVALLDNTFQPNLDKFSKLLSQNKPILTGISAVETTRQTAHQMCRIAREAGCHVIAGGPDPVNSMESYFDSGADFICSGEGEITLTALIKTLKEGNDDIERIPGLYYRKNSSIIFTGNRDLISDISLIPNPAWDMISLNDYFERWKNAHNETSLPVISSRGCPHSCTWCSKSVFGRTYRRRSPEDFVSEISFLKDKFNPDYFWFADDSFTSSLDWLNNFKTELSLKGLNIVYECLGRVDEIQSETAFLLKETGCRFVWFGAESGSQRILDSMRKKFTVDQIIHARKVMADTGIPVGFFIMLGYPPEDRTDINQTIQLIRQTKPDKIGVSIAYPISGTEFCEQVLNDKRSSSWTRSGENRLVFRTRYPSGFYFFARRLIHKESHMALTSNTVSSIDHLKSSIYRIGMNIHSLLGKNS